MRGNHPGVGRINCVQSSENDFAIKLIQAADRGNWYRSLRMAPKRFVSLQKGACYKAIPLHLQHQGHQQQQQQRRRQQQQQQEAAGGSSSSSSSSSRGRGISSKGAAYIPAVIRASVLRASKSQANISSRITRMLVCS